MARFMTRFIPGIPGWRRRRNLSQVAVGRLRTGVRLAMAGFLGLSVACSVQPGTAPGTAPEQPAAGAPAAAPRTSAPAQTAGAPRKSTVDSPVPAAAPLNEGRLGWAGMAFIGGGESNKLWILDARQHKLVNSIEVGGPLVERTDPRRYPNLRDAHAMVFSKNFKDMYTVNSWEYALSWVIKYDPLTLKEVGRVAAGEGGHHLALSPDDRFLYVGNEYDTKVSVIDTASLTKVKDIVVGSGPDYISPSMYWDGKPIDSPYLFVSVDKDNLVAVIDWRTNEMVKAIPFKGSIHGVNITPDGKTVWAAIIGTKEIAVIDVATLNVTKMIPVEKGGPVHIVFSPNGNWAYVTAGGQLLQYNTRNYELGWVSATGGAHLGVTPDGKEVWTLAHTFEQTDRYPYVMAGGPLSNAKVVDAETGEFLAEMPFEYRPHEIQFVPYSALGQPKITSAVPSDAPTAVPTTAAAATQRAALTQAGAAATPRPATAPPVSPTLAPTAVPAAVPATTGSTSGLVSTVKVIAQNDIFLPDAVSAKGGEQLEFEITNRDAHLHDFVTMPGVPGDVNVDLPGQQTVKIPWTVPVAAGKYQFICDIHPGQQLTVTVP